MELENIPEEIKKNQYEKRIPKIIHQISPKDKSKWNECWFSCSESWKQYYKEEDGYEYKMWNDEEDMEEFIKEKYNWYYPIFINFDKKIKKIDVFRFFILYEFGGIYADMDYECLSPFLNDLCIDNSPHSVYIPESPFVHLQYLHNSMMISVPKHPFWLYLINETFYTTNLQVVDSTGPRLLDKIYYIYIFLNNENEIKVLNKDEYNPEFWEEDEEITSGESILPLKLNRTSMGKKFHDNKVKCRHYCSLTWKRD